MIDDRVGHPWYTGYAKLRRRKKKRLSSDCMARLETRCPPLTMTPSVQIRRHLIWGIRDSEAIDTECSVSTCNNVEFAEYREFMAVIHQIVHPSIIQSHMHYRAEHARNISQ